MLNETKSKYIIFNRTQADFNTRLTSNDKAIDQVHDGRLLGVLLSDDLKFDRNTQKFISLNRNEMVVCSPRSLLESILGI